MKEFAIVFGYWRRIKYSVNILVGAMESEDLNNYLDILLAGKEELPQVLVYASQRYKTVIYGQTLLTTELPVNLTLIREALKISKSKGIITAAGGPHASGDPYGTLLSLGYDFVFIGDSEETLIEFINAVINGGDPKATQGIAYIDRDRFVWRGKGFLSDLNKYPPFAPKHRLFNPIEITRGCPFACKYCQVSFVFSARQRHRDVDNVLLWANHLLSVGIKDIRFITPNSLGYGSHERGVNFNKVAELLGKLQTIRSKGGRIYIGTFPSEIRPEHVSEEAAKLLKKSVDNKRITIGAQSGSNRLLKSMNRGHTAEDVLNAVETLTKHGFGVDVDYIFGLPNETEEDLEETIKHINEVTALGARVHGHVFLPLPSTPYSFAPPGKVKQKILKHIHKLLGRGMVFGQWKKQEELASKIAELRDKGIIIISAERAKKLMNERKTRE